MSASATLPRLIAIGLVGLSMGACTSTATKLSELGNTPAMTKIQNPVAPAQPPLTMPTPTPISASPQAGSMWQAGARAFFKDQRASRVGDILTVNININESAQLANETQGARNDTNQVGANNLLGYASLAKSLFGAKPNTQVSTPGLVNTSGVMSTDGKGSINRSEQIKLQVAATVTQVLPNGNMVVVGKQELRVNYDLRELAFTGIVKPGDIDTTNTIDWPKIAEARMSYGGRGQSEDLQQPRVGNQLIDILSPF